MTHTILAISGSLRSRSYNSGLLASFKARAPEGVSIDIADISKVPLYNQDDEGDFPQVVTDLKERIRSAHGIIIATPEYNRSVPGVLKNVIDWTSRPYGDSAWKRKPVFVMGASGGPIATAVAQYELKKILLYVDAHVMGQPEFYLGLASSKFNEEGVLTDPSTLEHVDSGVEAFARFIDSVS